MALDRLRLPKRASADDVRKVDHEREILKFYVDILLCTESFLIPFVIYCLGGSDG